MEVVYATDAVIAIRRQIDRRKDVVSLARLLEEVRDNPQVLSRARYVGLFRKSLKRNAGDQFDRLIGQGTPHIDPGLPAGDLDQLQRYSNNIKRFANKRVAHAGKTDAGVPATHGDLNACIDIVDKLTVKYVNFIRAETLLNGTLLPTILYDWKRVFRESWIPPHRSERHQRSP